MERPNISPTTFRTAFVLILVLAVIAAVPRGDVAVPETAPPRRDARRLMPAAL